MRGLHRFLHHLDQPAGEAIQVYFVSRGPAESLQRPGGVVLATVEAAVYERLDATPQRNKEGRNRQGGDDDCQIVAVAQERAEQLLKEYDASPINQGKRAS